LDHRSSEWRLDGEAVVHIIILEVRCPLKGLFQESYLEHFPRNNLPLKSRQRLALDGVGAQPIQGLLANKAGLELPQILPPVLDLNPTGRLFHFGAHIMDLLQRMNC